MTTNYVHRDHLGSPELITHSSGIEVVKLSFGAFGERRDRDWHGPVSSADMTAIGNTTRRGFTEHEHLDSVGLVHMNGRVYDPILGRFLASDPVADGLGRPGGFNRYAYVKNNPLTLIDPSGLSSKETKLPKHDAGRHGPLLEVIDVIAERFWLPLGGTLAWTIVSAGSLGPAFVPSFAGGGGSGGSGGSNGGDTATGKEEKSKNSPNDGSRDSCTARLNSNENRSGSGGGNWRSESRGADRLTSDDLSRLSRLNPHVGRLAEQHLVKARSAGITVRVAATYRSASQQNALPTGVTNARGGFSFHQYGLAYDLNAYNERGNYISDGAHPAYRTWGTLGEELGLTWGGRWETPFDPSHFEFSGGASIHEVRENVGNGCTPLGH